MKPPRKVKRKHGYVWEVRYREGGRNRSRTFDRKSDAEDFQAEVRRRKRLGTLAHLHSGEELLADFAVEWRRMHARPNLQRSTLERYSQVWDKHVLPRLGMYRLQELTPEVVAEFRGELSENGVGDATVRKAMFILQGVLGMAVLHGRIAGNPVKAVRKPRQTSRTVRPLAPETVEAIRARLRLRDATLVSVLAYAGLRPGEALALSWRNVRERTILIDRAVSLGKEKGTKTNATRTVRLLAPLSDDLAAWRSASAPATDAALVFPRPDGLPWRDDDYRNWRKRGYNPAAIAAGLDSTRPCDLRHSFVSLLINEGVSIVEVARQAGHSPEECLAHLRAHVRGVRPRGTCPSGDSDRPGARGAARAECTRFVRACRRGDARRARIWLYRAKPTVGFEPTTPALRERCSGQLSYVGGTASLARPAGGDFRRAAPYVGMGTRRLERLPALVLADGSRLAVADARTARALGLAGLRKLPARTGLLIPDCRSVHTFGMRFALDLIWLGDDGRIVDVSASVPPRRIVTRAHARAVVECRSGTGAAFFTALATAPAGSIPTRRRAARAARTRR